MIPPLTNLTAPEITVLISGIGILGVILGALIGAGSSILTAHLTRRAEDLRHRRMIGIEIGRAKFDLAREMANHIARSTGEIVTVPSLDSHLVNGIKVMEIVTTRISLPSRSGASFPSWLSLARQ